MSELVLLAVGLDGYQNLQPLRYAVDDAREVRDFLVETRMTTADRCALLTEQSPPTEDGIDTQPTLAACQKLVEAWLPRHVEAEDTVWVFWSGYAINNDGRDYLLLSDSDPDRLEDTALAAQTLFDRLQDLPSDRINLFLDINRPTAPQAGQPIASEIVRLAEKFNIPVLLSCRMEERSRESRYLRQGLFTTALIAALRYHQCHTLEAVCAYLRERLPQLGDQCWQPHQTPLLVASAAQKQRLLLPKLDDTPDAIAAIDDLKKPKRSDADQASNKEDRLMSTVSKSDGSKSSASRSRGLLQLVGGLGAIAAFLMIGVMVSSDSDSTNEETSSSVVTETTPPPTIPTPDTTESAALLNEAESMLEPGQASSYRRAINLLQSIPADSPAYEEAQAQIEAWSREIWTIAQTRARNGQVEFAIQAARLVPSQSSLYPVAQTEIETWRDRLPTSSP